MPMCITECVGQRFFKELASTLWQTLAAGQVCRLPESTDFLDFSGLPEGCG